MEIQNSNDSIPKKWPDSLNSENHLGSFNIDFHLCFPILSVDFTLRLLSPGLSLSRTPGPCSSCSSLQCASQSVQLQTRKKIKLREAKEKQIVEGIKWGNTVKHNETEKSWLPNIFDGRVQASRRSTLLIIRGRMECFKMREKNWHSDHPNLVDQKACLNKASICANFINGAFLGEFRRFTPPWQVRWVPRKPGSSHLRNAPLFKRK